MELVSVFYTERITYEGVLLREFKEMLALLWETIFFFHTRC